VANFPIARQRKYVLMLKKGLELTRPLDNIVQTLSMNMSKQSSSSWKSLLLPLDVTHACNASLQSRAYLSDFSCCKANGNINSLSVFFFHRVGV